MRFLTGWVLGMVGTLALVLTSVGVLGYVVYGRSSVDPLQPVDAIIVLGGQFDGRQEYGIELARSGISKNVVISDWLVGKSSKIRDICETGDPGITVTCIPPRPSTTRGEALFTQELATRNGWRSVLVISWRYHLPRARYIFSQCFDGQIVMRPVPRDYNFSLAEWEYTYLYQTVGFVKAVVQGKC